MFLSVVIKGVDNNSGEHSLRWVKTNEYEQSKD